MKAYAQIIFFFFYVFSIDGGVANNDFIVQLISTLTRKKIERRNDVESAALGVAFLSGLHSGKTTIIPEARMVQIL